MTHTNRLGIALISLAMPLVAMAVSPASVTGIAATSENGKVTVTWDASSDSDVSYYRVYVSRMSILENGGEYDDFEPTKGKETTLTLSEVPSAPTLYVGVMAVNSKGEESAYFTEEASVSMGAAVSSSSAAMSATSSVASSVTSSVTSSASSVSTLSLVSVLPVSATGVLLTFSADVEVPQLITDAAKAFSIKTASGEVLAITRIVAIGNQVTLWTVKQEKDEAYVVSVTDVLKAKNGAMPLDPIARKAAFTGHMLGFVGSSSSATSGAIPEVANLNLHAEAKTNGTYTVTIDWRPGNGATGITGYQLRQTRDGGDSYSAAQEVSAETTSVRFQNVSPGTFGLLIMTIAGDKKSAGALGTITLPKIGGSSSSVPHTDPEKLPESGPLSAVIFLLAGAATGATEVRRRMKKLEA